MAWPIPRYLDVMTGLAPVGAWGTRRLVSTYNGPILQVRNTSTGAITDIFADANGKLILTGVGASSAVTILYDQSGNGEDLIQPDEARQPRMQWADNDTFFSHMLNFTVTSRYWLYGKNTTKTAAYMVPRPTWLIGLMGKSGFAPWGSLFTISETIGNHVTRLLFSLDGTSNSYRVMANNTYNNQPFAAGTFATPQRGGMVWAFDMVTGVVRAGSPYIANNTGYNVNVTYPNPTRLAVGKADWDDLNNNTNAFNGYLSELTVFSGSTLTADQWGAHAEEIRICTLDPKINGMTWRLVIDSNWQTGNANCAIAEIELAETIDGADKIPATNNFLLPHSNFDSGTTEIKAVDNNNSTQWATKTILADNWPIAYTLRLSPASAPINSVELRIQARAAPYHYQVPQKLRVQLLYDGAWQTLGSADWSGEGNSGGQIYKTAIAQVAQPPTITSIVPASGPYTGGTPITITGANLTDASRVLVNSVDCQSFTVVSSTEITAVTPAVLHLGASPVKIIGPTGIEAVKNGGFTYLPVGDAPSISVVSPSVGGLAGDDEVTITGANFNGIKSVKFDGIAALAFTIIDENTIVCRTPAHAAGLVDITIEAVVGTASAIGAYTYQQTIYSRVTQSLALVASAPNQPVKLTAVNALVLANPRKGSIVTASTALVLGLPLKGSVVTATAALAMGVNPPTPAPLAIVPEIPVQEIWEWLTVITIAKTGNEQRASLRPNPRVMQSINALLLDYGDRNKALQIIQSQLTKTFNYPLYQYSTHLTADVDASADYIPCDPASSDLRAGELVALVDPTLRTTILRQAVAVDAGGVRLSAPVGVPDIGPGWQIAPAPEFRLDPSIGITSGPLAGEVAFPLTGTVTRGVLREGQASAVPTLLGRPYLNVRSLADGVDETFTRGTDWLDNQTAPPVPRTWRQAVYSSGARSFVCQRRTGLDFWRAFLAKINGRQKTFYMPTWRDDIVVNQLVIVGTSILTTDDLQLVDYWRGVNYRNVLLIGDNGEFINSIVEVLPVYINGVHTYSTIKLASVCQARGNVRLSFIQLCRLDDDKVTLVHGAVDTVLTLAIRTVEA